MYTMMKRLKLILAVMMISIAIPSKAQTTTNMLKDYYVYAWAEVRWANKATGEPCFVILITPGDEGQQLPSILKNDKGKIAMFQNMMDGLSYLEIQGWELYEPRSVGKIGSWIIRKKISYEELAKTVAERTTYTNEIPKIQLELWEQQKHVDYK